MEKLKKGDYCENLTKEQFDELLFMNEINFQKYNLQVWFVFFIKKTKELSMTIVDYGTTDEQYKEIDKNKLSFEDFKNRATNMLKK